MGAAGQEMNRALRFAAVFLVFAGANAARSAESRYTRSMFASAVRSDWTSPRYLLLSLRDPGTNSDHLVCIPGSSLVSAIQIEKGWSYAIGARTKARGFAMRHWKKPFVFENSNALARVQPGYSEKQLAQVQARLARFSDAELRSQLRMSKRHSAEQTELQKMCASPNAPLAYANRAAIAHVLLERGILVANDARTGQLRLP
jgi:hypothetical protein